jgi:ribonuclease Z
MRVTMCGTGAGVNTALRANAGIVLQANDHTIMLDCGGGSVREAVRGGIAIRAIEAVLLSHLHQDHCVDLAVILSNRAFGGLPPPDVFGPPGTESFVKGGAVYVAAMAHETLDVPFCREVADASESDVLGFAVRWVETPHAPGLIALAQRLTVDGQTVVYSGDTQPAPSVMVPLAEGADVLIHECYSRERMERVVPTLTPQAAAGVHHFTDAHSEVRDVAAIARDAGVRRLVLTHLLSGEEPSELWEIAGGIFKGEIVVAQDGMSFEV